MALDPHEILRTGAAPEPGPNAAPLAGTRAERVQRLQVGLFGIIAMVMLVGLADAITSRAQLAEENAVPEAAPTVVASETAAPRDPMAEAGVVPDVQVTPNPSASASPTAGAPGDVPPPTTNAPLQ